MEFRTIWPGALWLNSSRRALQAFGLSLAFAVGFVPSLAQGQAADDFTLIALPDTQWYTCSSGGNCENGLGLFDSQTGWIAANRDALDIRFVTLLGDCAQNGNVSAEYDIADAAFQLIEDASSLDYPDGIPFGIAVGNHDQSPTANPGTLGNEGSTTGTFNSYFGVSRFCPGPGDTDCVSYYGDHYGINNDNHYDLFSANGYDFIVVHIEYMSSDTALRQAVISWADGVLSTHSDRRAIIVTHHAMGVGTGGSFGNQGEALYLGLRDNPNLFLILAGHVHGEGRRSDTYQGRTVHTVLSDYQDYPNGGNGYLRILTFQPSANQIAITTYSPFLDQFESDSTSEFTLSYDMDSGLPGGATATLTFQQGTDGYAGAVDTFLEDGGGPNGSDTLLGWEDDSPILEATLLKFDGIFVSNGGPIADGATITSAVINYVTGDGGDAADVYTVSHDWAESAEFDDFGGTAGFQLGEDYTGPAIGQASGGGAGNDERLEHSVTVTDAVVAWSADSSANYGVIFVPTGASGTGMQSSEFGTVADRPQLSVTYVTGPVVPPETAWFQQDVDGYVGAADTFLNEGTGPWGALPSMSWDQTPPKSALLRFGDLFSAEGGPILEGSEITLAELDYTAYHDGHIANVYMVSHSWDDATATFDNFGATPGAQAGEDYVALLIAEAPGDTDPPETNTPFTLDVTSAVELWAADPASNYGLIFVGTGPSGTAIRSSEYSASLIDRPLLRVTYTPPACVVDADCDDELVCTADTCDAGVCTYTPIPDCCDDDLDCDDSNVCMVNTCNLSINECVDTPAVGGGNCGDSGECFIQDTCDGAGQCGDNGFELGGSACGDPTATECNLSDSCDGAGACLDNFQGEGLGCGSSTATTCNGADTCDGAGECQMNWESQGLACGSPGTQCINPDTCDGSGACGAGQSVTCGDGNSCTADSCDEVMGCVYDPIPGCVELPESTVSHFDFNEWGNTPGNSGQDRRPVKMRDDSGDPEDFHTPDGEGVSGFAGDRAFANTGPDDHGADASSSSNGFRADQGDNPAIDGLSGFTLSGWFKTETTDTLVGKTPRLINNHSGSAGFNLQFLSGADGELKLEVDDDSEEASSTGLFYSAKQTWVFFAVTYDGTASTDNVNFYVGFRDDLEAGSVGSAAVQLVSTATLDHGPVGNDTAGLTIGNRPADNRPFDGFLDDIRIDDEAFEGATALAILESYRQSSLIAPENVSFNEVSVFPLDSSEAGAPELSGITYDPDTGNFWTISDNDGLLQEVVVVFDDDGVILSADPISVVALDSIRDYESVVFTNTARNSVFVCDEPDQGIYEHDRATGNQLQSLSVPAIFDERRSNRGFEALARNAEGTSMLAGVEQALVPDGPVGTSTTAGNISRLLRYSVDGNDATPAEQYAYELEPLHQTGSGDGSSLSELVYLPDGRLIALERSDAGGEFLVRAFLTTTEGATDVSQGSFATGLAATGSGQAPGGGAGNDDPLDHSVDVTAAVTAWSVDPSTNYGVVFFPTGASGTGARTSEHGTADDRPELTVTYEAVPDPVTVTFQQGSGGYTGTVDTFIDLAGGPYGGSTEMSWEDDPGESPDVLEITLLRFEGIFDTNGGPVPAGATISSASIAYVTQDGGDAADVFIVTHDWDESVEYDDFGATPGAQEGEDYSGSAVDGPGYVPLSKKLLFSDDGLGKLEGLAAGPTLPNGNLVFVGVTDEFSNYSDIRSFVLSLDLAECGNGTIDAGESCDDGNEVGGDCCSAVCQVEIDGSACDDELFCTAVDTCSSGVCGGVGVTDCSASDDQCNVGVCNEGTDSCDASPNNVGNACDDGQFCTSGENCSAVGVCDDGGATDCSGAADDCNVGVCNEGTDSCDAQASNEAGGCDDAQFCTTGEVCTAGACGGGGATDCSGTDDDCNVGVCNESSDVCDAQPTNLGLACDDGLFCTVGETCSASGVCDWSLIWGTSQDCSASADDCNAGVCHEGSNLCESVPSNEGGACDNGDACTASVCSSGGCDVGPAVDCDDSDPCTNDSCDGATGCVNEPIEGCNIQSVPFASDSGRLVLAMMLVLVGLGFGYWRTHPRVV